MKFLRVLLFALPLLFLGIFFFYPLLSLLRYSLVTEDALALPAIGKMLSTPYFWRTLWFTTWQALVSTLLTLLTGLPLAYVFARFQFPGKSLLRALTTIPFVMPTVVVAAGFTTLIGNQGVINQWAQAIFHLETAPIHLLQTIWIILIAHVFYNVSVVVRTVGGFWENLNPHITEAARLLGASSWRLWVEVTLPLLLPSILAAGLLVFLFCFTSFGVVLILGGLQFATLEVEIYQQARSLLNLPVAAFLSLLQLFLTLLIMSIYTRFQERSSVPLDMRPVHRSARRPVTCSQRLVIGAALLFILGVLLAPLLALAWRSFTLGGQGLTGRYYLELLVNRRQSAFFVTPVVAIGNSLRVAFLAMLFSLLLGLLSAYLLAQRQNRLRRWLDPLFLLPLGTSAVTLGFGYTLALGTLRTSPLLTPIAHTLIAFPFVLRTFLPALRSLDPRLRAAAAVLGASPLRVWWEIDAPLLLRSALVGAVFAFTISLGEFGATLLVSRPDSPTLPLMIYRALSQPGALNYGQALAMSTILMVVCTLALVLIERFRLPGSEEF